MVGNARPLVNQISAKEFKPIRDMVVIKYLDQGDILTPGGLVVPQQGNSDGENDVITPIKAQVIAVGPGRRSDMETDKIIPMECKVGDTIFIDKTLMRVQRIWLDGVVHGIVRDRDIVAIAQVNLAGV